MKNNIRIVLLRWLARIVLKWPTPNTIHLSPPDSLGNDFYRLFLSAYDETWSFNVRGIEKGGLSGWYFESSRPGSGGAESSLPNGTTSSASLKFEHYYKGYIFSYNGIFHSLVHHYTRFYFLYRIYDRIAQIFYNKKNLVNKDRYEMLSILLRRGIIDRNSYHDLFSIVEEIYGRRWISHPRHNNILNYYAILMDSLVDAGEVQKGKYDSYRIGGKGLSTIWEYEENIRKHKDNVRQQTVLGVLTAALVLIGVGELAVQAFQYFWPNG